MYFKWLFPLNVECRGVWMSWKQRDGLRCVVSGGENDVYSALTWWKVLSPWSFIHYLEQLRKVDWPLLPHRWSDWEPGESLTWPSTQLGTHRQDLALVPLSHDCLSVLLSPPWGWRQSRSQKLGSCSDSLRPALEPGVLIKRQGWYHLILLMCGTWENGTGELICRTEIGSQM